MRLVLDLSEEVLVVQLLLTQIRIIMYHTWQLSAVVVVIDLRTPTVKGICRPYQVQFTMTRAHPTVGAVFCLVIQFEGIVVLCVCIFSDSRKGYLFREVLLIAQERTDKAEGTSLQLGCQVRTDILSRHTDGLYIQHSRGRGISGRDKDVIVVTYHQ